MSEPINDGGAAYPVAGMRLHNDDFIYPHPGMSLRDRFAMEALSSLTYRFVDSVDLDWSYDTVAHECYRMADAMLKARQK